MTLFPYSGALIRDMEDREEVAKMINSTPRPTLKYLDKEGRQGENGDCQPPHGDQSPSSLHGVRGVISEIKETERMIEGGEIVCCGGVSALVLGS